MSTNKNSGKNREEACKPRINRNELASLKQIIESIQSVAQELSTINREVLTMEKQFREWVLENLFTNEADAEAFINDDFEP